MKDRKKIIIIFSVIIICFVVLFFSFNYIINNNYSYVNDLKSDISSKCNINDDVLDINVYGGYYIINTFKDVYVFDYECNKIFSDSIDKLGANEKELKLVYRTNKLMYEETVVKNDSVIYNYYDAYSNEFINSIVFELGGVYE